MGRLSEGKAVLKTLTISAAIAAGLTLTGCGTSIPQDGLDSGTGAGFGSNGDYETRREAELAGETPGEFGNDGDDIAAQTRAALGTDPEELAANSGEPIVQAGPNNPAPEITNNAGMSAENNFDAVSERRSIEDDAARVASNRSQYRVAQVRALPGRSGGSGPNIVSYALSTNNVPGTQLYKRRGLNLDAKNQRNCAAYPGPDMAQIDFLKRGGPKKDRLSLDPDGDGFACGWDPRPFRRAARS